MTEPVSAEGYGDVLSGRLMKLRNKQPMRHSLVRLLNEGGSRLKEGTGGLVVPGFGDYVAQGIAEVSRIVELSPQDYWRPKFVRLGLQYRENKAHSVLFMEGKVLDLAGAWVATGDPSVVPRAMAGHEHMLTLYVPFEVYKYPLTFAFTSATEMHKWASRISDACHEELTARDGGLGRFRVLLLSVHGAEQFSLQVGHAGYSVRSTTADSCPIEVKDVPMIHSNPNSCVKISVWLEQPGERGPPVKGLEVHCPLYEVSKRRSQIITYEPPLDTKEAAVSNRIERIQFIVEVEGGSFPVWSRYLMPVRGPECGWPQELTINNFTDASLGPCFRRIGQDFSLARGLADKIQAVSYFERPLVSVVWLIGLSIWVVYLYEYTLFFLFSLGILSLLKRHPLALTVRSKARGWTGRLRHYKWEKVEDVMESGERMDVYESERRLFLFADFSSEHLLLWDPPQWSTLVRGPEGGALKTVPCKGPRTIMSDGSCWSWQVIVDSSTDENGYQYSMTFGDGNGWLKECDAWCYVRRRCFRGAKVRAAPAAAVSESQSEGGLRRRVLSVQLLPRASSSLSVEGESPSLSPTPVMAMPRSTVPTPWEVLFNKLKQHIEDTLLAVLSACMVLEKIKNLFGWKCPWASSVALCLLILLAALSALIPTRFVIQSIIISYFISGFTIGVRRRNRRRGFIEKIKEAAKSKRQLRSFVSSLVIDSWGPSTRLDDLGCPLLSLCGWVNRKYNVTIDLRTMQQIATLLDLVELVARKCQWFYDPQLGSGRDSQRDWSSQLTLNNIFDHVPSDCDLHDPRSITFLS